MICKGWFYTAASSVRKQTEPGRYFIELHSWNSGRVCYGIELNAAYVDAAVQRWQDFTGERAVVAGRGQVIDDLRALGSRISL